MVLLAVSSLSTPSDGHDAIIFLAVFPSLLLARRPVFLQLFAAKIEKFSPRPAVAIRSALWLDDGRLFCLVHGRAAASAANARRMDRFSICLCLFVPASEIYEGFRPRAQGIHVRTFHRPLFLSFHPLARLAKCSTQPPPQYPYLQATLARCLFALPDGNESPSTHTRAVLFTS